MYPKRMHKKGGPFSLLHKGVRQSFDITKATDKKDEDRLLKAGWDFLLVDVLNPKVKAKKKAKADK